MDAISDGPQTLKFVHTYGAGLHGTETDPDVNDPRWQRRQVEDFVQFAVEAEELGFDGVTVTEHHAPLMTCPSPHLLLAAAAVKTSRIRLGTAVTVLPLYNPVRVAEEAGTLDLLSGGRFELGLGRGVPGEALFAVGRDLSPDELNQGWAESLELLHLALTGRDFTFDGAFHKITRPTTIATRPLQDPLPVWLGGSSLDTMGRAAERGWSIMRNFGSNTEHRDALDHYVKVAAGHGYARTGANMMIERFVAIGDTAEEADRNLAKLAGSFGRFLSLYTAGGRRPVPQTDAEFHVNGAAATPNRPAIAVSGTPDQLIEELQQVLDETGSRRLLVELFSARERRMFMDEVAPALRDGTELRSYAVREVRDVGCSAAWRSAAWRPTLGALTADFPEPWLLSAASLREASLREAGLACFGVYVYPVAMAVFCVASESSPPLRRITVVCRIALICDIPLVYRPAPRPGIRDVPRLHPELKDRALGRRPCQGSQRTHSSPHGTHSSPHAESINSAGPGNGNFR